MAEPKVGMDTVQWFFSTGTNIHEEGQLDDELSRLRSTLPRARLIINRGEWGMFKNKDLAVLLRQLKDATYDAEDLLREFDDQKLRREIEDADRSMAAQLVSSLHDFVKTVVVGSKTRIRDAQHKLDAEIEGVLNLVGPNDEAVQHMPETSSVIGVSQVFGRDKERDQLIERLGVTIARDTERDQVIKLLGVPLTRGGTSAQAKGKRRATTSASRAKRQKGESSSAGAGLAEAKCISNVPVLPIVGIGGVGKTTLAQYIYNDSRVKAHFAKRIWVCVSDVFDMRRITREVIESISGEEYKSSASFAALQVELAEQLIRHKFFLVLDDIWPNANAKWEAFFAPFRNGLKGSMILVTTRSKNVANLVATRNCDPLQLEGLDREIFWEFFRKCAFGEASPESYPPQLEDIGKRIASRLCGSPLAAKTLGRLLSMDLTVQHWETIEKSELWELPHQENEILPALQLSYLYLPQQLKICFAFCSMFPKDYSFERDEIVDIWVAEGFVATEVRMRAEDTGIKYLDDLRSRFLFQTDPKYPGKTRYVMHDLIHDMAQSISVDECFLMHRLSYQNQGITNAVRHMSVEVNGESLNEMGDNEHLKKLRSLRFGIKLEVEITWFTKLSNIVFLSLKGCKLVTLPDSICNLTSLRYFDISQSRVEKLPKKFWRLYSLQVVDASRSSLKEIAPDVTKLTNLRRLALPAGCSDKIARFPGLGNLSRLRNLKVFVVGRGNGRTIGELKCMNQISGKLTIREIRNVRNKEEAEEARLFEKQYLKSLHLDSGRWCRSENEVLEGLRPPPRLEHLVVKGFEWDSFPPSWLKQESLPTLRSLELHSCASIESLSIPSWVSLEELVLNSVGIKALTVVADDTPGGGDRTQQASSIVSSSNVGIACLTRLRIEGCGLLENLDQCLSPECLPSIKSIEIKHCNELVSIPAHSFVGFTHLQDLQICWCRKLVCPREMVLPPSLRRLCMVGSFPACLENQASLIAMCLYSFHKMESIPTSTLKSLQYLTLERCWELSSIGDGGSDALSSIRECPKLHQVQVQQPFIRGQLTKEEVKLHRDFLSRLMKFEHEFFSP